MRLKRYCVTVMDHWTPMRDFWTLEGAKKFYRQHRQCANVFKWNGQEHLWEWMCGAHDRGLMLTPWDAARGLSVSRPGRESPNGKAQQ